MERTSKILDWRGNPIRMQQLKHEQTTRIGMLDRQFENHPSRGLTPARLASILQRAEHGELLDQMDLFEDMEEKDAHIYTELTKRKRVLQGLNWSIVPPRNASAKEEKQTELISELFQDLDNFEDIIFDMADGIGKGFSNHEIKWVMEDGYRLPHLTHRTARMFTVGTEDRDQLRLRLEGGKSEPLWPMGWMSHVHKAKTGYISRAGLHRILAWPYLFKNWSVRDLAEFLEIYGLPVRIGTYPSGASDTEKSTLMNAVTSIGHNAAGIMPEGMMIDFKDAASGQSDPYKAMIDWCESSQSKAILGGTLTTSAENTGLGSNLGNVHNDVRMDLRDSDAKQIAGTITRDLIWPMVALNIGGANPRLSPRFKFILDEEEDLKIRSERDKVLFDMGYRLNAEKVEEVYGEGYEFIGDKNKPKPEPGQAATAAAKAEPKEPDFTDNQVQQLQDATSPAIDGLLDKINELLDEAKTMEEFQDRLVKAYGHMDIDELADIVQLGMSAAELAGRVDVQEGE